MKYVEVCKALYDYEARTPDEITIHEDDILYVVEKEDDDWWRAELKVNGEPGLTGLVPATYLTECEPVGRVEAEYDYAAQHEEELTFAEGDTMLVLERDDPDWLLVKMEKTGEIGLAPGNYVRDIDGQGQMSAIGQQQTQEDIEEEHYEDAVSSPQYEEPEPEVAAGAAAAAASPPVSTPTPPSIVTPPIVTPVNAHATGARAVEPDDAQSWTVHDYDPAKKKKKKNKGNLLIGNGMICYGSETDKTLPVQKYSILDVTKYLFDGKNLHIEIAGPRPSTLDLQAASKSEAKAILVKITDSRNIAQRAATHVRSPQESHVEEADRYDQTREQQPAMPPRLVPAAEPACEPRWGFVSYNFTAEAGDEIDVQENEQVLVIDHVRDDGWWQIEKTDGRQGIVPSSYVLLNEDYDNDAERKREEEEKQRRILLERAEEEERRRQAEEEERRRRQREAEEEERRRQEEAQRREEEERRRKLQEAARRAELTRQRQIEEENRKRAEAERRRSTNLQRTATLPEQGSDARASGLSRSQSVSASNQDLPKPDMTRVRTWTDRSGAFKVDAQFLTFYDGKFRLHKTNGVKIDVPVEKMSLEDVQWVENHLGRKVTNASGAIPDDEPTPPMPPRPQAGAAAAGPSTSKPAKQEKKVNPNWDWFDWFMMIGIPMEAALIYASAFKADKLDDSDIPNLTHKRMKTLGVKEKHVQRIERYIENEKPEPPSDNEDEQAEEQQTKGGPSKQQAHLESDEELARRLYREWNGQEAPKAARPKPSKSAPKEIHPDLLEFIGTQFTADTPSSDKAPTKGAAPPDNLIGFDDDAWTPREEAKRLPSTNVAKQPQSPLQPVQAAPTGVSQPATVTPPPPAPPAPPAVPPAPVPPPPPQQQQQQQPPQAQVPIPPRQRPVSTLKHTADPTLSHWQQQTGTNQSQPQPSTGQLQGQPTGSVQVQQPSLQMLQQQQQQIPMQTGAQMDNFAVTAAAPQTQTYSQPPSNTMSPQYAFPQQQMMQATGQQFMHQQQPPQWQQMPIQAQMTGFQAPQQQQQFAQVTGFQQQPHVPMQAQMTDIQQQPPQQQPFSMYQRQQQPSWQGAVATGYQQPMTMSQVPLSSILPQPLVPAPNQRASLVNTSQMGVSVQPTGIRNWQSATPDNPFGSPLDSTVAPLSPQRTGVQFSTPNSNMFTQSPLQGQPTGYLQPQMTGVPNNNNMSDSVDRYAAFKNSSTMSQPSIFTLAGSMAYAQSSFQKEHRW